MAVTTNRQNRYPAGTDPANVPQDIQNLATDLDNVANVYTGTLALRPSASALAGHASGSPGSLYVATDTNQLFLSYGGAWHELKTQAQRGKTNIATPESRTGTITSYGLLPTPDRVSGIILPADSLIMVGFYGLWQESVNGAGAACIFLNSVPVQINNGSGGGTIDTAAFMINTANGPNKYAALVSTPDGLYSGGPAGVAMPSPVTTGQVLGDVLTSLNGRGGLCTIFAAAGTYDVSVQFKASSGNVTVKDRKLWVWTETF